jgi:hypothetical protein
VKAVNARQMTEEQQRRFEATIDAWLDVLVRRYFDRQQGEISNEQSKYRQHQLRSSAPQ